MRENIAREKSLAFSIRIVNLHKYLRNVKREYTLSDQVLRSGTSIGANISEAEYALSDRDMFSKLHIALKEASETQYWLELLYHTAYLSEREYRSLLSECIELKRLLIASTNKKTKKVEVQKD